MAKEISDIVVIEGTLSRDSSGNLTIKSSNTSFNQVGYYTANNKDKLAEKAFESGYKIGDKIKYICILQKE